MKLKSLTAILLSATFLAGSIAGDVAAQSRDVTLKSFDGFTQLRGKLIDFTGEQYVIETALGQLRIDALQVECEGEACPEDLLYGAKFGIHGSNTIGSALMPLLIDGYAEQMEAQVVRELTATENESIYRLTAANGREIAEIDLVAHSSGNSFADLADGRASLGMSSRRMRDAEAAIFASRGAGDLRGSEYEQVIALDGLLVLTHPSNPLNHIEFDDLADVFAGEITNWSELGGPNQEITVHAPAADTGTFDSFESLVLDPWGLSIDPNARRFESNSELSDTVASTPGSIGFAGAAFTRAAKVLDLRQACGILSKPTEFAMKTEEYPLARRLYLYSSPLDRQPHAKKLLDFALSDPAQDLIEDAGFVSLRQERVTIADQGTRLVHAITGEDEVSFNDLREMLTELRDAERLTTTFRFNQGSTQLDARSTREVQLMAQALQDGEFAGSEVLLIGFTDSIGQFDLNRNLSLRRAEQVRQELARIVGPGFVDLPLQILGYGELAPVGCNTTFEGRQVNRRVEVWVRPQG